MHYRDRIDNRQETPAEAGEELTKESKRADAT
jgi:hypothetical protein